MGRTRGTPQVRGVVRREEILVAAKELFARRGYHATSLVAVAEEVGMTAPGVLHHFPTKEALLVAVLEEFDRAHRNSWDAIVSDGGLSALRRLPALAESIMEDRALMQLFAVVLDENLGPDAPLRDFFTRRYRHARRWLADVIRSGQERGEIARTVDASATAAEILAFQDGALNQWLLDPDGTDLLGLYRTFSDRLVAALSVKPPARGRAAPSP